MKKFISGENRKDYSTILFHPKEKNRKGSLAQVVECFPSKEQGL
jgi:hypothetical protein